MVTQSKHPRQCRLKSLQLNQVNVLIGLVRHARWSWATDHWQSAMSLNKNLCIKVAGCFWVAVLKAVKWGSHASR